MPPFCGWMCLSPSRPDLGWAPLCTRVIVPTPLEGHTAVWEAPLGSWRSAGLLGCWANQGPGRVGRLPTSQGSDPGPVTLELFCSAAGHMASW